MANETQLTIIGNLTADPEIKYTQSGTPVANFTIASTPRVFDRQSNEWRDGETLFMRCSVWRDYAEHIAESLSKGMQVIAHGDLGQRSYETKEGEKRTVVELRVEDVGPTLRFATAKVTRAQPKNSGGSFSQPAQQSAPVNDPWSTDAQGGQAGFGDASDPNSPPF